MAFVLGMTVLIAIIGFYFVRQLRERQRMAAALVAKEADSRLLAEQSSDMVMRIGLDERILYVSPSCARIVGWDAINRSINKFIFLLTGSSAGDSLVA
jgi:PAS domain-containing protein